MTSRRSGLDRITGTFGGFALRARLAAVVFACLAAGLAVGVVFSGASDTVTLSSTNPSTVYSGLPTTFNMTFSSALSSGNTGPLVVTLPAGWSQPSTATATNGTCATGPGTPTIGGDATGYTVTVTGYSCGNAKTFTLAFASIPSGSGAQPFRVTSQGAALTTQPSATVVVDSTAPTVGWACATATSPTTGDWATCPASWTNASRVLVRASVSDGQSGLAASIATAASQSTTPSDLSAGSSTCDDVTAGTAGLASCVFVWSRTSDTAVDGVTYTITGAVDRLGNSAATSSSTLLRDATAPSAPTIACSDSLACQGFGFWSTVPSVTLTASGSSDALSGVVRYEARTSTDGTVWSAWTTAASDQVAVTREGKTTVELRAVDAAGNTASASQMTRLDRTNPGVAYTCSTTSATAGDFTTCASWYRTNVWVKATLTDNASGFGTAMTTAASQSSGSDLNAAASTCDDITSGTAGLLSCVFVWGRTSDTTSAGITYTVNVADRADLTATGTKTVGRDSAGPTTAWTCSTTSASSGFGACPTGWTNTSTWVKATVSDAVSGLAGSITTAGTQSPAGSDLVAGSSTCSTATAGTASCDFVWYRTTDTTSGGVTYSVTAADQAGTTSPASTQNLKRDTAAPTVSYTCSTTSATATDFTTCTAWYKVNVWVKAAVADPGAGLSIATSSGDSQSPAGTDLVTASSTCRTIADGAASCVFVWARTADTTSGGVTYGVTAIDKAASSATATKTVGRDTAGPTVAWLDPTTATTITSLDPTAPYTFRWSASDAGAGVASSSGLLQSLPAPCTGTTWSTVGAVTNGSATTLTVNYCYRVVVSANDTLGNGSTSTSAQVRYPMGGDTTSPTGSFTINGGADATNGTSVRLALAYTDGTGSGVVAMHFSNDEGATWSAWESIASSKLWTLAAGADGPRTVSVQYEDLAGNDSLVYTLPITLDTAVPTGSVVVNGGADYTSGLAVTLAIAGSDGAGTGITAMKVRNLTGTTGDWVPYATTYPWRLADSDGTRTVVVDFRDAAGNVTAGTILDTIVLDRVAPTITWTCQSLRPNGTLSGYAACATTPYTAVVYVKATVADATARLAASITTADSQTPSGSDLSTGASTCRTASDGTATCDFVWIRTTDTLGSGVTYAVAAADKAGLTTSGSKTVIRDTVAPSGSFTINGGPTDATANTAVTLRVSATDGTGTGLASIRVSNDNVTFTSFSPAATIPWALAASDGTKTVYVQFTDVAGLTSTSVTSTIALDTTGPVVAWDCSTTSATSGFATCAAPPTWYPQTVWVRATVTDANTGLGTGTASGASATDLLPGGSCATVVSGASSCSFVWSRIADTSSGGVAYSLAAFDRLGNPTMSTQRVARDTTGPVGSLTIPGGGFSAAAPITLGISGLDLGAGVDQMAFSDDGQTWTSWIPFATSYDWTLPGADGSKTVYLQLMDVLGNVSSATISATSVLDTAAPDIAWSCTTVASPTASDWASCAANGWYAASVWVRARVTDPTAGFTTPLTYSATDLQAGPSSCISASAGATSCDLVWRRTSDTTSSGVAYTVNLTDRAGNAASGSQTIKRDTVNPTAGSIAINGGIAYVSTTTATVNVSATDNANGSGVAFLRFSNDNSVWGDWTAYTTTPSWTMTPGDGLKTVYVQFRDLAGNSSGTLSDTVIVDTLPPTGTVLVAGGVDLTTNSVVRLTLSATDAGSGVASMRFSNDNSVWGDWTAYTTSATWALSAGDGPKTVYAQFRDLGGALSVGTISDAITLDATGPAIAWACSTTAVDSGYGACPTDWTTATSIWVRATLSDSVTGIASVTDTQAPAGADLVSASSTCKTLTAGAASCTLVWRRTTDTTTGGTTYGVSARDVATNASAGSQLLRRDVLAPATPSVVVNANAAATGTTAVTLALAASDGAAGSGVVSVRLSNDGATWTDWSTMTASRAWTLVAGDGSKTVSAQFRDAAGNVSATATDAILLDTTAPTGTMVINGGADYTSSTSVTLNFAVADGSGSGVVDARTSTDGTTWGAWSAYAATRAATLPSGVGLKTIYAEVRDAVGNVLALSDTITYDNGTTRIVFACATTTSPVEADYTTCTSASWYNAPTVTVRATVTSAGAGLAASINSGDSQSPAGTDLSSADSSCKTAPAGTTSCVFVWKRTTDTTSGGTTYTVTARDLAGNPAITGSQTIKRDGTGLAVAWACATKTGANQSPTNNDWGACATPWYGNVYVWVRATVSDTLSGLTSSIVNGDAQSPAGTDLQTSSSTCKTWTAGTTSCVFVWRRATDTTAGGVAYIVAAPDAAGNATLPRQIVKRQTTGTPSVAWACSSAADPTAGTFGACGTGWLGGPLTTVRATVTDATSGLAASIATAGTATDRSAALSTCDDVTAGTAGVNSCVFVWQRAADTASTGSTYTVTSPTNAAGLVGATTSQTVKRDGGSPTIAWACSTAANPTAGDYSVCDTAAYTSSVWIRATVADPTSGLAASITTGASQSSGADLSTGASTCRTATAGTASCVFVWRRTTDTAADGVVYSVVVTDVAGNASSGSQTILRGIFGPIVTWSCSTVVAPTDADWAPCATNWYTTLPVWVRASASEGTGVGISASMASGASQSAGNDLQAGSSCLTVADGATSCEFLWLRSTGTPSAGIAYSVLATDLNGRSNRSGVGLKVDDTAPTAPSTPATAPTGFTAATSVTVTVATPATDPESGLVSTVIYRRSAPLSGGVCGTYDAGTPVTSPDVAPTGTCAVYSVTATNAAGLFVSSAESLPVMIDATAPTAPGAPTASLSGFTTATSVTVSDGAAATDPQSGIASSALYRRMAVLTNGVCGTYGAGALHPSPDTSLIGGYCYTYYTLATNTAGLSTASPETPAIFVDTTAPSIPAAPIVGQAGFTSAASIDVTVGTSADPESGIASTTVFRRSAPLAAGLCGTYGTGVAVTLPDASAATGFCHVYYSVATNRVGLTATSADSAAVKVDRTAPTAPPLPTTSPTGFTSSTTVALSGGAGGTDPESGVTSTVIYRRSAPLAGGLCGAYGAPTVSGTLDTVAAGGSCYVYSVVSTNAVGLSSSSGDTIAVKVDTTAPVVSGLTTTTPSGPTNAASIAIVPATAADAESGTASIQLYRRSALATATGCGAFGSRLPVSSPDTAISADLCYVYSTDITNAVGLTASSGDSAPVRIDRTAPTVISFAAPVATTDQTTVTYALAFSEEVVGLATTDFTTGGTSAGWTVRSISGAGASYSVIVGTNGSATGSVLVSLLAGSVLDLAGNTGPALAAAAPSVSYVPPAVLTPTTTTVSPSSASVGFGTSVTLTATVAPVTTGSVTFSANSVTLGSCTLSAGSCAIATSVLPVGTNSVSATFSGNATYGSSVGSTSVAVAKALTTTTLTTSTATLGYGGSLVLTATVAPTAASGAVTFSANGTTVGSCTLSSGACSISSASLPVGTVALVAAYAGDPSYASSQGTGSVSVTPAITSTSVAASATSITVGSPVTLTATVIPAGSSGSVAFTSSGASLGSCTLASGTCSITTAALPIGTASVLATYAGDPTHAGSSGSISISVGKAPASLGVAASVGSTTFGSAVTFTAVVAPAGASGSVAFTADGGASLGSCTLASGTCSVTTNALAVGARTVTAVYGGDATYLGASGTASVVVAKAPTVMTLSASAQSVALGAAVTITAAVSPTAASGTVSFTGATWSATCVLSAGSCSVTTTSLPSGNVEVTASYGGDATYETSTAKTTVSVGLTPTTTSVAAASASVAYGGSTTLTATVAPSVATGTIVFASGTWSAGCTLTAGSCSVPSGPLPVGSNTISATYSGDGAYGRSAGTTTLTVTRAASTTALAVASASIAYGSALGLTATVGPAGAGGSVTFTANGTAVGSCTLAGGTCSISVSGLAVGGYALAAAYAGDTSYAPSSGTASALVVQAVTVASVAVSSTSPVFGDAVTITAGVTPVTATGTMTILDGATSLGTCTLANGSCSLTTSALAVGGHSLAASYAGDTNHLGATSAARAITVARGSSSVVVTTSGATVGSGQAVTFTVTVTPASASGTVSVHDGGLLGTCTLTGATCQITTSALPVGSHLIVADYLGDATYSGSSSAPISQTVTASVSQTVTAAAGATVEVSAGSSFGSPAISFTAATTSSYTVSFASIANPDSPTSSPFVVGLTMMYVDITVASSGGSATGPFSICLAGAAPTRLWHYENGGWVDVTNAAPNDYVGGKVCGTTTTLSPFAVAAEKPATALTLASDRATAVVGDTIAFTATLDAPTATGRILFFADGATLGSCTLSAGACTYRTSALAGGNRTIGAVYLGDAAFLGSSASLVQAIDRLASWALVGAVPTSITSGDAVTVRASVTPGATGTVRFTANGLALDSCTLASGTCAIVTTALPVGSVAVIATYEGDGTYLPAVSPAAVVTVAPAVTITLAPAPAYVLVNGRTTFSGTASSGASIRYRTTTSTVCSVSGATVTGLRIGTCTIVAETTDGGSATVALPIKSAVTMPTTRLVGGVSVSSNPTYVKKGVTVILKLATKPTLAGKIVQVQIRIGTGSWVKLTTRKVDAYGKATFSFVASRKDVSYRWLYLGDTRYILSKSLAYRFFLK